jgi:hypothetical protein
VLQGTFKKRTHNVVCSLATLRQLLYIRRFQKKAYFPIEIHFASTHAKLNRQSLSSIVEDYFGGEGEGQSGANSQQ